MNTDENKCGICAAKLREPHPTGVTRMEWLISNAENVSKTTGIPLIMVLGEAFNEIHAAHE